MYIQTGKLSNGHLLAIIIASLLAVLLSFNIGVRVGRMEDKTKLSAETAISPSGKGPSLSVPARSTSARQRTAQQLTQPKRREEVKVAPRPQPLSAAKGYTIQLGAFISPERASNLAEELRGKGYEARVKFRNNFHRVFVGYFNTRSEAKRFAERMKRNLNLKEYLLTKP
ncbi:TPA: SPOR domain-containing protein [Candidatus Poribacteria bacterium]|nr:SPOR domain-containing protein [Candidatus Poribacteria bacterium]